MSDPEEVRPIALALDSVSKHYGRARGITDVTFTVKQGETFGFLGPNGAGKSTTINLILDLLHASTGTISVLGLDSHKDSVAIRQRIGYLASDMAMDATLTGNQFLRYVAALRGNVDWQNVEQLIERLACEPNKKIKNLSRGNRQKLGLVAALMHNPDLLILDEPTSGLDPLTQAEFRKILAERKAAGKTTFMSSHELSEVQEICDVIGFIKGGELLRVITLEEYYRTAAKNIIATYSDQAPDTQLRGLPGVSDYKIDSSKRYLKFNGSINELLRVLNLKPLLDLEIREPSLEESFMSLYEKESGNA